MHYILSNLRFYLLFIYVSSHIVSFSNSKTIEILVLNKDLFRFYITYREYIIYYMFSFDILFVDIMISQNEMENVYMKMRLGVEEGKV